MRDASEVADRSTPVGRRLLPAAADSAYKFLKKHSPPGAIVPSERMRRFTVVLVLAAVASAASTAGAAHGVVAKTDGGGWIELFDGAGLAKVRKHGTFIGNVRRGKIVATANVLVTGCEHRTTVGGQRIRCKGRELKVITIGASKWRLKLRGRGISGSGKVRGCLVLDGRNSGSTGTFRRDFQGDPKPWPRSRTQYRLGSGSC